jgi:sulfur relay protein TusB/DsrH
MIIISDYDPEKLRIALDLLEKTDDKRVLLLSDAIYFFNSDKRDSVDKMLNLGAQLIALETDLHKRGVKSDTTRVTSVSYEELVSQMLETKGCVINL